MTRLPLTVWAFLYYCNSWCIDCSVLFAAALLLVFDEVLEQVFSDILLVA